MNLSKVINTILEPWRAYLVEFFATFVFVFFALGINLVDLLHQNLGALAVGLVVGAIYTGLLYSTIHISGGYMNPAICLALWFARKLSWEKALVFSFLQIAAGFLAVILLVYFFGGAAVDFKFGLVLPENVNVQTALVLEFIFSSVLVFAVFSTMVDRNGPVSFGPLVLGVIIASFTVFALPISGASFNPAKAVGAGILSNSVPALIVGAVGPIAASLIAFIYDFLFLRKISKG